MKYITMDEMYNWMPIRDKDMADAQIPDELAQKLHDALTFYTNVCIQIYQYLEEHPDDEFEI